MTKQKPVVLELFSGTGSWGKVFRRKGMDVTSVDILEKFHPDIVADVLELDYKKLPVPDLITASPPCNSFSRLAVTAKTRDWWTLKPLKPSAELGEKLAYKTLEIIRYFLKKNPNLLFVIENPTAMLRRMPVYNKLPRESTKYCLYKFRYRKPTDFFHNFPKGLGLKEEDTAKKSKWCDPSIMVNTSSVPLLQKYRIPSGIALDVWHAFQDQYKKEAPLPISFRKTKPILIEPSHSP